MSYTEFELLAIAEDIEEGDTVTVEDENGDTIDMVYVSTGKKGVKLRDSDGELHLFSADSLEEIGGYCVIVGKSEERLSVKR